VNAEQFNAEHAEYLRRFVYIAVPVVVLGAALLLAIPAWWMRRRRQRAQEAPQRTFPSVLAFPTYTTVVASYAVSTLVFMVVFTLRFPDEPRRIDGVLVAAWFVSLAAPLSVWTGHRVVTQVGGSVVRAVQGAVLVRVAASVFFLALGMLTWTSSDVSEGSRATMDAEGLAWMLGDLSIAAMCGAVGGMLAKRAQR